MEKMEKGPEEIGLGGSFSEKAIRMAFIRKVYAILMLQLAITVAFICLFMYCEPVKEYTYAHVEMVYVGFVLTFVIVIVLACCEGVRRSHPTNLICLIVFTIIESFLVGTICSFYDVDEVMWAIGTTAIVCLGLTVYAFQTKYDFTMCGGFLYVTLLVFFVFGLLTIRYHSSDDILRPVYASLGALLFSFYLIYDTQILIGGNHKYAISPEEHIFAALNIYLDIINLFLYLLRLFGSR